MRRAARVTLSNEEWARLRAIIADRDTPRRVRQRARILIQASEGRTNREIARTLGVDVATVALWRRRFETHRFDRGLRDAPRQGRRSAVSARTAERILHTTYNVAPTNGQRWTTRTLSGYLGVNHMLVHRIWKSRGVEPSRPLSSPSSSGGIAFTRPKSSSFVDLLGVFVKPPARAVMFGIQDVEASAPIRPEGPSIAPRTDISGGYLVRPTYASGEDLMYIIEGIQDAVPIQGSAEPSIRDLLILLRELEERTPPSTQVHVITEQWSQEAGQRLAQWLEAHPRFFLHSVAAGERWSDRVRSFLELWSPSSLHRASFAGVPSFAMAAIRFAGTEPTNLDGLIWSSGSSNETSRQNKVGRISVTDLSGLSTP